MGARQRSGVARVVDNRKRQGAVLTQEVSGPFKGYAGCWCSNRPYSSALEALVSQIPDAPPGVND